MGSSGMAGGSGEEPLPFAYGVAIEPPPACAGWAFPAVDARGDPVAAPLSAPAHSAAMEFEQLLAEEARRSFEAGRECGRQEGSAAERQAQQAALAEDSGRRAAQLARLAEDFAAARDCYLERVEHEVVRLALAVAARILRREAQMDPLLLLGAVRVALGQLAGTTRVRLRVPASELGLWSEAAALLPGRRLQLEVTGEDDMLLGDCLLETELGSVDLGVRAQLGEIERGFFDRAAAAPAPAREAGERA